MGYANTGTIISVHSFLERHPGLFFVNVLIPAKSDGKLLEIEIENPYKDDDSAKLDEMYIGDISDIIQFQQQKDSILSVSALLLWYWVL